MAEPAAKPAKPTGTPAAAASAPPPAPAGPPRLKDLWQAPALVLGVALFVAGAVMSMKSKPPYDMTAALVRVEEMIGEERTVEALTLLSEEIQPRVDSGQASDTQRRRFHILRGDALALNQHQAGGRQAELAEGIVREYEEAEALGETLDAVRVARIAGGMLTLGRLPDALRRIETIPTGTNDRRRLLREVVEASLQGVRRSGGGTVVGEKLGQTLELLSRLAADASQSDDDRAWAYARQAELRLAAGYPDDAVEHLLQDIMRLPEGARGRAGELYVLLGRGYYETGRFDDAARQLDRAQASLESSSPMLAEVSLLLGRIAQARSAHEEARERFNAVLTEFPETQAGAEALLGVAEAESAQAAFDSAVERYAKAADIFFADPGKNVGPRRDALRSELDTSLKQRSAERLDAGDETTALRLAAIGERLGTGPVQAGERREPGVPAWVNLTIATANRALGQKLLAPAQLETGKVDWTRVDPVTRAEARKRFTEAASRFAAHARQVIGRDDEAYGRSLWSAADASDRSGDFDRAIRLFGEFASGRPGDPKNAAARFRAALAHQARGDFTLAADMFRGLIAEDPQSGERLRSLVPLAQCLIGDNDPSNDEEAERLLRQAVTGEIMPPDAPDFRVALLELGEFYHRRSRHPEAVARLSEYIDRFPDATPATANAPAGQGFGGAPSPTLMVRLLLADSLRLSAGEITRALAEAMPASRRQELVSMREERLRRAFDLYEQACTEIVDLDHRRLNELEKVSVRNAFFYRADCAFDLARYDAAIERYDVAANRYTDDPASLVAMIQIVNAYAQQGKWEEARTANERAKERFKELPEASFKRSDLPMERRHWERWLDASAQITERGAPVEGIR